MYCVCILGILLPIVSPVIKNIVTKINAHSVKKMMIRRPNCFVSFLLAVVN
jgi:Tfp pilus assembly protein PilE